MVVGINTVPLPQGSCGESPGVGVGVVASFDRPLARFVSAAEVQLSQPDGDVADLDELFFKLLVRRRRAYPPIPTSATPHERSEMLQMVYPKIVVVYRCVSQDLDLSFINYCRIGLRPEQYTRAMGKEVAAVRSMYLPIECSHNLTCFSAAMARVMREFKETIVPLPQMAYIAIGGAKLRVQPVPAAMGDGFGNCAPGSVFECANLSLSLSLHSALN